MPRLCIASLESLTQYSQSGFFRTPKPDKMGHDEYEKTFWREKAHVRDDGRLFIPPMAFKFAVTEAGRRLGRKIPGKGNATYGKRLEGGFLCMDEIVLDLRAEDIQSVTIPANANGRRGAGTRVFRTFPLIESWAADVRFWLTDDIITETVFEDAVAEAGQFVGIGRFRPENGGYFGRWKVTHFQWDADTAAQAAE